MKEYSVKVPKHIALIGVGYVGLPLAVCFSKKIKVTAFDLSINRITELKAGRDRTKEVTTDALKSSSVHFTHNKEDLKDLDFFIVTVPTPVDEFNTPDLTPLLSTCATIAPYLKKGSIIVFESTVYPGLTEEILAPKLEELSGLKFNSDFFLGYSPERVNPGDKDHTIPKIKKIVAGSNIETLEVIANVYGTIIEAGIHRAPNIRTAEAAKVIENIQRDVNIGLINELTVLFDRMGLNVHEVLEASSTKWNFLKFKPGLVGGHCIGVDPFYLTYKAQEAGFHPEMILAGRRINDSMPNFFANKIIKHMLMKKSSPLDARLLILGFTFKENCPDVRNTKVYELAKALEQYNIKVDIFDPVADKELAKKEYNIDLLSSLPKNIEYNSAVLAVPHQEIMSLLKSGLEPFLKPGGFILDIKGVLPVGMNVLH